MSGLNNPPFFTHQTTKSYQDDCKLHVYIPLPNTIVRIPSYHLSASKVYFVQIDELWKIDEFPVVKLYDKIHDRFTPLIVNPNGRICTYDLSSNEYTLVEISKLEHDSNDLYILSCLDDQLCELIPVTDIGIEPLQELTEVFSLVTENGLWIVNGQLIVDSSTFVSGNTDIDIQVVSKDSIVEREVTKHIIDLEDLTIDELLQTT